MLISQRGRRYQFDIVVIGSGTAGLSFCYKLLQKRPNTKVALISKTELQESNSVYAQGGIAAVALGKDSVEQHIQDTLQAGAGFCDPEAVEAIVSRGPAAISFLQELGIRFDHDEQRHIALGREGGHSQRRIFHHGDQTGRAVVDGLLAGIKQLNNITVFEHHTVVNLIHQDERHVPGSQREVIGAYILEENSGLIHTFLANGIVLATGGAGKVYRYTSNPEVATGDGIAMAYRAGARIGNMEFYQFHPTLLYHAEHNNFLITEALRGEGAYLRLPDSGKRFMEFYDSKQMELSTRDKVARAIFTEIEKTARNYVYLDIRHKSKEFLQQHFPNIYSTLKDLGIDMATDQIPVVPAVHYLCGGVLTDVHGRTDIKRLYAIGETAFTGLHGANRLASNSLLECLVMADLCVDIIGTDLDNTAQLLQPIPDWDSQSVTDLRRASQLNAHWRGLRGEMTSYAGIIRTEAGLQDLLKLIKSRKTMIENYYWKHTITKDLLELRNIVLVAELIVRSALSRRESRGAHYREDYPHTLSNYKREILLRSHEQLRFRSEAADVE